MFEPSEELFIQNICSRPGDELAVGIYADWLEEQGDLRAEQVRNFYHGVPLSNEFQPLLNRLSWDQCINCAILFAKDVLPLFEKAASNEPALTAALVTAIEATEKGTVTREIIDNVRAAGGEFWHPSNEDGNHKIYYAGMTAANAAWASISEEFSLVRDRTYYTVRRALQAKPERREAYLMIISSFILFGCNAVVLD